MHATCTLACTRAMARHLWIVYADAGMHRCQLRAADGNFAAMVASHNHHRWCGGRVSLLIHVTRNNRRVFEIFCHDLNLSLDA